MKHKKIAGKRGLPLYATVLFALAGLAAILEVAGVCAPRFADWFNRGIGAFFRTVLAHMTSWLPFSLAEFFLYSVPFLIVGIGVYAARHHCGSWRDCFLYLASLVSVFSLFFTLFVFSFGMGYHALTLPEKMDLEAGKVGTAELAAVTAYVIEQMNQAADGVSFGEDGFAVMPYTLAEMNEKLLTAYKAVGEQYSFVRSFQSRVKPVLASHAMSYTHITGVYTYFTGEANLNTYFPDYTLPFTAAHELAHQRGFAREEEANFIAFLVCEVSEDPYIRYSAYRNLYEYMASALYRGDRETYRALVQTLDVRVVEELRAYYAFFEPFRNSAASKISDTVNDTYLKLHGNEEGTASYGLVVDLAVAYLKGRQ